MEIKLLVLFSWRIFYFFCINSFQFSFDCNVWKWLYFNWLFTNTLITAVTAVTAVRQFLIFRVFYFPFSSLKKAKRGNKSIIQNDFWFLLLTYLVWTMRSVSRAISSVLFEAGRDKSRGSLLLSVSGRLFSVKKGLRFTEPSRLMVGKYCLFFREHQNDWKWRPLDIAPWVSLRFHCKAYVA